MTEQVTRKGYITGGWSYEGRSKRKVAKKTKMCAECGSAFKHPHRYYCSERCAVKFYLANHVGLTWADVRVKVFDRDGIICSRCGHSGSGSDGFEVDHIEEIAKGGAEFDMANLQVLCQDCHRGKTNLFLRRKSLLKDARLNLKLEAFA